MVAIVERWPLVEVRLSLKAKIICCVGFELTGQHGGVSLYGLRGASATLKMSPFTLKKNSSYLMSYLAGTGVIITSGVSTAVAAVAAVQAACDIEEFPRPHIMLCKGPRM